MLNPRKIQEMLRAKQRIEIGAARVLLRVATENPEAVLAAAA